MMSNRVLAAVCLLAVASRAMAADDPTEKLTGVHDLDASNFDSIVNGGKAAFLEFFAPWCGHCKHLTPEYKRLGEAIAADPTLNSRVLIGKVDADEHRELGEKFGVTGFPTLKWLPKGRNAPEHAVSYQGARTADAMKAWIAERLKKDDAFARVPELTEIAIAFMGDEKDGDEAMKEMKETAASMGGDMKENAQLYIKYVEKAVEKGKGYIQKELERLQRMSEGGKMSSSKLMEINRKMSVLQSFDKDAIAQGEEDSYYGYDDLAGYMDGLDLELPSDDQQDEYEDEDEYVKEE